MTVVPSAYDGLSEESAAAIAAEAQWSLPPLDMTDVPAEDTTLAIPSADSAPQSPQPAASLSADRLWSWLPMLLAVVLGGGAIAGLLQLAGGLFSVRTYRRSSQPLDDADLLELVDCLRAELSVTRRVEVRESNHLATAATLGWARPVILLPPAWREWTGNQRRAVLAHELAHVARGDYLACVLAQLSLAIHFYHPLVHWLAARLRLEQELAADATAAMLSGGRKIYLQSLAELALHTTERPLGWPAHTFLPTQGTFLRRIEMLRDSKRAPSATSRRGIVQRWAAVGLLLLGAAAIAGLRGGSSATPFDSTTNAQQPAAKAEVASSDSAIDLAHVTNDAKMLLAIRPKEVAKVPEIREALEGLRQGDAASPLSLMTMEGLEQITLIGLTSAGPENGVIVLQFNKATEFEAVAKAGAWPEDAQRLSARALVGAADAPRQAYGVLNDRTIVLGSGDMVGKYLANRRKGEPAIAGGAAWEKVRKGALVAAMDMEIVRDMFRKHPPNTAGEAFAKSLAPVAPLWTDSEYVLTGILVEGKTVHLRAIATCHDEELAENVADTVEAAATLARNMIRSARENQRDIPRFAELGMDTADGLLKSVKVERNETLVVAQTSTELPKAGSTVASNLVEAISASRVAAARSQSMNNMKQIMLAMHNWADTYGGRFPPPVILGQDGKGKVPHSWRVALLPYLGEDELYKQYKFDEPWDSEANKKVLAKMPPAFRHPQDDPKSTSAAYFVLVPEKLLETTPAPGGGESAPEGGFPTAFSDKKGMPFRQIFDGTSNTLGVVEAKRDIPWTKPEDILFDPAKDPPKLGGYFKEGFNGAICDGSVRFFLHTVDPKTLKLYIMPQDGQPIPP